MNQNQLRQLYLQTGILFLLAISVKIVSLFHGWTELHYSIGWYPWFAAILRKLSGWFPFSVGDLLYTWFGIILLVSLIKILRALLRKNVSMLRFYTGLLKTLRTILWIYLIFNLFWGLNYNRLGIAYQLKLHPAVYTTPELKSLTDSLIIRLNNAKTETSMGVSPKPPYTVIFAKAVSAYRIAAKNYPYLSYHNPSIKASLFGKLGDYLGFLGYYNPFTGESQVNVTIPSFLLPYTTCHEIAHQLGYATEDAANFVGYLTALSTPDPAFHYSAYFDLFNYANTELFYRDSAAARANFYKLNSLVRKDERTYRDFFRSYQNPAEPFITDLYSRYLKENNQPEGIETYSRVTAWLIAFQKKFHRL